MGSLKFLSEVTAEFDMHLVPGRASVNVGPLVADVSNASLNTNSGPSVGASSLVTDANSGLSGDPHTQASTSFNTESYMRLPTSPLSFSSNNISISGSSVIDGSSAVQQSSNQDLVLQPQQNQHNMTQLRKKPRLDIKQEDVLQQQVLHQLLQRQDPIALQNPNPQLQALVQQQRLRQLQQQQQQQREQLLQSMPPMHRVQLLQQQQQLRQQLLQQGMSSGSEIKRPYDGGVCSRRLMQYLFHQRQWPTDNNIAYWRKFVAEYYSPRAKKRWCLSLYDNVGHHSPGVFPQAAMDAWQCDICGSKSGRGFEATFEVLPRLNEIKFGSGIIDELLFLDLPRECRFTSGTMMLEYAKAVSESVYEQLRVVREGQLRIIFTPDLKILSWEFCARHHEQLLPRRLIAPQVNQLLQVAQKCQSSISDSGPDGVSQPDLQANNVMVLAAGRQLTRSLELQSLNDLGFSKRYVRCLQISKVVSSMKDLMGFCTAKKVGPIEGLKNFPHHSSTPKVQMQEMALSGGSTDPGLNSLMNDNDQLVVSQEGPMTGSAQAAALALSNYPNLLTRQNLTNSALNKNNINNNNNNSSLEEATSGNLSPPAVNRFWQNRQLQLTQPGPSPGGPVLHSRKNNGRVGPQLPQSPIHIQNQGGGPRNAFGNPPTSRSEGFKGGPTGEDSGFGPRAVHVTQNLDLGDGLVEDVAQEFIDNGFFSSDLDEII